MIKETIKTVNLNRAASMREKVMRLTGFNEAQMNALVFDMAVDYMKGMHMSEDWLTIWLKEPLFWGWWKQQWSLIDESFWYKYAGNMDREDVIMELQNRYKKLHASIDKFPDEIVYEKIHSSYEVAGQKILQKIRSKNNN
ncbi:MAG: hypothetical protein WCO44_12530 [Bacteroidota bacterium]